MPGLAAQPLRPGGITTEPPALPPEPEPAVPPLVPPAPVAPAAPVGAATHALFEQIWPAVHTMPQLPQLAGSLTVFTQAFEHALVPVGQLEVHMPAPHNGAVESQTLPHAPQFMGFEVRSVQTLLHLVAHCAVPPAVPFDPPAPGELPLPLAPLGPPVGVPAEQLTARIAEEARVSEAPTKRARNALVFGRNRFHIKAPNLVQGWKRLRRRATSAQLDVLHSAPTVARNAVRESAHKSTLSLKLGCLSQFARRQRQELFPTADKFVFALSEG